MFIFNIYYEIKKNMITSFNKFNFINNNFINEDYGSEFLQYQFDLGPEPLGPGYGFAYDPQVSIYGFSDSRYSDKYSRNRGMTKTLQNMMNYVYNGQDYLNIKNDNFINDVDFFNNLKILRININNMRYLDIFISFEFNDVEFFGVFKNFNWISKPILKSDLFSDPRFKYIDHEYILKLSNYFFKILSNWFSPKLGFYKNLLEGNSVKNDMGKIFKIKKNAIVEVIEVNTDDNSPVIKIKIKNNIYTIEKNDYFWFKYRFEKIKDTLK